MLKDIIFVEALDGYRLRLRFEDGAEGLVNVKQMIPFEGVFAPLKDEGEFRRVRVNPEFGCIAWPCGVDLDPDVLYATVTGAPIRSLEVR